MPMTEQQVDPAAEQPAVGQPDTLHKTIAAEFAKRIKGVDWRTLGWNMKNDEKTGALTISITFPGNSAMEQTMITKQQQQQDGRRPTEAPVAATPAPAAPAAAPAPEPTAQAMASRKVEVKVAMTKEAAVNLAKEKYPPKFLKAMGL